MQLMNVSSQAEWNPTASYLVQKLVCDNVIRIQCLCVFKKDLSATQSVAIIGSSLDLIGTWSKDLRTDMPE